MLAVTPPSGRGVRGDRGPARAPIDPRSRPDPPASGHLKFKPTTGGTGTPVPERAETTRTSRPMSWAEPRVLPSGGRRRTQREPPWSVTR